jgi:hypothetical protein
MGARLAKKGDLFKPVLKCKQNLSVTIEKADNLFKESKHGGQRVVVQFEFMSKCLSAR